MSEVQVEMKAVTFAPVAATAGLPPGPFKEVFATERGRDVAQSPFPWTPFEKKKAGTLIRSCLLIDSQEVFNHLHLRAHQTVYPLSPDYS